MAKLPQCMAKCHSELAKITRQKENKVKGNPIISYGLSPHVQFVSQEYIYIYIYMYTSDEIQTVKMI